MATIANARASDTLTRLVRPLITSEAAKVLGVPYYQLHGLIRRGLMAEPGRDGSGRYLWSADDVERARAALKVDRRFRAHKTAAAG
jgi:DNA-binding transcriptional MerR regulator